MKEYTIRPARQSDRSPIRRLIWRVGINPFALHWENFLVAEGPRRQLAGCGQLKPHGRAIELASIAVAEEARGKGIATAIITQLIERGPRPLYLTCLPQMIPFYERFGFVLALDTRLPLHFRRLLRIASLIRLLHRSRAPVVMRLA